MTFTIGTQITLDVTITVDNAPDDPDSLVLVVTDPTGDTTVVTTSHDDTGHFTGLFTPTLSGGHSYSLTSTDSTAGPAYASGTFWVADASTNPPDGDIGLVRLLISDLAEPPTFSNFEIQAFLTLEGDVVKLAAAQALDAIASNEALVSKRIRTLDLQTDGPAVAKALRDHANSLREQHYSAGEGEFEVTTNLGIPGTPLDVFL